MIDETKFDKLEKEELENVTGGCGDEKTPTYNGYPTRSSGWAPCDWGKSTGLVSCKRCFYFYDIPYEEQSEYDNLNGYCKKG